MSEFALPSLWENIDLETGLDQLARLRFDEAKKNLQDARKHQVGNPDVIAAAVAACTYWKRSVAELSVNTPTNEWIAGFQEQIAEYAFVPQLERLKKNLLRLLATHAEQYPGLQDSTLEALFDTLLTAKVQDAAESLITRYCMAHPETYRLLYLLAQAAWHNNSRSKAISHYKKALLYYPDPAMLDRLEDPELKKLAKKYPPELVPAYAWIEGKHSLIPIVDQPTPLHDAHGKAVAGYGYLRQAHNALLQQQDPLPARAKLKEVAPELYAAYFEMLKAK